MPLDFSNTERYIKNFFKKDETFILDNTIYKVILSGKPTCSYGEPKTDIFILAADVTNNSKQIQIKISFKKSNADFLENKISAERAQQILGPNWSNIIKQSTLKLKDKFCNRKLIFKEQEGRTRAGSITLGWKFELVNKNNGELSGKLSLTSKELLDIYSGNNLSDDKKNSYVCNKMVNGSGVANYFLIGDAENFNNAQSVIDNMIDIKTYINKNPNIYFACKALNYRTFEHKFDGNRPLAVYVNWTAKDNTLYPTIEFDNPLNIKGNFVADRLVKALNKLGVSTTDDLNVK